ncbi:GAF domain-containing protein [Sphingomonas sp. PP-CC-3A-396]|uniref:GAF domain-containing protein n=1 Tax=Sphingomonas sp. PP-CC-3A-396 TaxID=2135655 RepID=UPI0014046003|nr:GAF domain-containing protein [Sphingomonas sp. PP-CC-3A-396]
MSFSLYTIADKPENEREREDAIARSRILNSPHIDRLKPILNELKSILNVKSAAITIVYQDSTYVLSAVGFQAGVYSRSKSFCAHAILYPDELTIVPDTGADERFAGNPFVDTAQGIRFYIGAPLLDENGTVLGALCAFDEYPCENIPADAKERIKYLQREAEATLHDISKQTYAAGGQEDKARQNRQWL